MIHKIHTLKSTTITLLAVSAITLGVLASTIYTQTARAHEIENAANHVHPSEATQAREDAAARVSERRIAANEKLSSVKLKACEKREANINNRTTRIADRTSHHLEVFTKISERTQAFYTTKGYMLDNYETLVADVNAKKAAAEIAVVDITSQKSTFDCDTDPKQSIESFKSSLKSSITALQEYRTAIKDLIVGVKSANKTTTDNTTDSSTGETE